MTTIEKLFYGHIRPHEKIIDPESQFAVFQDLLISSDEDLTRLLPENCKGAYGLVFSGPLHMAKPDPAIFRFLLEKYRLSPEETLFTDDNPKNIETAKELDLHTFLFDGDSKKILQYVKVGFDGDNI